MLIIVDKKVLIRKSMKMLPVFASHICYPLNPVLHNYPPVGPTAAAGSLWQPLLASRHAWRDSPAAPHLPGKGALGWQRLSTGKTMSSNVILSHLCVIYIYAYIYIYIYVHVCGCSCILPHSTVSVVNIVSLSFIGGCCLNQF